MEQPKLLALRIPELVVLVVDMQTLDKAVIILVSTHSRHVAISLSAPEPPLAPARTSSKLLRAVCIMKLLAGSSPSASAGQLGKDRVEFALARAKMAIPVVVCTPSCCVPVLHLVHPGPGNPAADIHHDSRIAERARASPNRIKKPSIDKAKAQ